MILGHWYLKIGQNPEGALKHLTKDTEENRKILSNSMNGQLKWEWWKENVWMVCLMGIPISLLMWLGTKWGYIGFGSLWSVRFMAFASSMIPFPIMTYLLLGEPMTMKVIATICLAVVIMIIQII